MFQQNQFTICGNCFGNKVKFVVTTSDERHLTTMTSPESSQVILILKIAFEYDYLPTKTNDHLFDPNWNNALVWLYMAWNITNSIKKMSYVKSALLQSNFKGGIILWPSEIKERKLNLNLFQTQHRHESLAIVSTESQLVYSELMQSFLLIAFSFKLENVLQVRQFYFHGLSNVSSNFINDINPFLRVVRRINVVVFTD